MTEKDRIYGKMSIICENVQSKTYIGEDDFVSLVKNGIAIYYHIKNRSLNLENIFRAVKRAQSKIREHFNHNLEAITVYVFNSPEEMSGHFLGHGTHWTGGVFDGRNAYVVAEPDDGDALYIHLTHEILHHAIHEISNGNCPFWLNEGVALHLSQYLSDTYLQQLAAALQNGLLFCFDVLEEGLPANDECVRRLTYAQCYSMIEYLVEGVVSPNPRNFGTLLTSMGYY